MFVQICLLNVLLQSQRTHNRHFTQSRIMFVHNMFVSWRICLYWAQQRGKKTLLSLTLICHCHLVDMEKIVRGSLRYNHETPLLVDLADWLYNDQMALPCLSLSNYMNSLMSIGVFKRSVSVFCVLDSVKTLTLGWNTPLEPILTRRLETHCCTFAGLLSILSLFKAIVQDAFRMGVWLGWHICYNATQVS